VILIAVGLSILFGHNRDKGQKRDKIETDTGSVTDEYFDISSIFNDIKRKIESPSVKGGKVTTIFGGAKIDLYNTSPQEKCVIDVLTVFGGTEIFAPADWKISNNVTAVFGGAEDKRRKSAPVAGEEKKLIITGSAIFGGLEIKS